MPCIVVQQATKYRRSIKPWKTKPVYRAHAADKRRRMTIGNQSIVGDWEGAHSAAPIKCVLLSSRGASAFSTRALSLWSNLAKDFYRIGVIGCLDWIFAVVQSSNGMCQETLQQSERFGFSVCHVV